MGFSSYNIKAGSLRHLDPVHCWAHGVDMKGTAVVTGYAVAAQACGSSLHPL